MSLDGNYDCLLQTPMGEQKSVFTVQTDGDTFTGQNAGERGTLQVENGKVDGNKLTWNMSLQQPMQISLACEATIEGDALDGTFTSNFGSMPFKGVRQQ